MVIPVAASRSAGAVPAIARPVVGRSRSRMRLPPSVPVRGVQRLVWNRRLRRSSAMVRPLLRANARNASAFLRPFRTKGLRSNRAHPSIGTGYFAPCRVRSPRYRFEAEIQARLAAPVSTTARQARGRLGRPAAPAGGRHDLPRSFCRLSLAGEARSDCSHGRRIPPRRHRSPRHKRDACSLPPLAAAALPARSVASLLQPPLLAPPPPPPPSPPPPLPPPSSSMLLPFPPFLHLMSRVAACVSVAAVTVRSAMLLRCVDRGGACSVCLNLLTCARVCCARSSVACAGVAMTDVVSSEVRE